MRWGGVASPGLLAELPEAVRGLAPPSEAEKEARLAALLTDFQASPALQAMQMECQIHPEHKARGAR